MKVRLRHQAGFSHPFSWEGVMVMMKPCVSLNPNSLSSCILQKATCAEAIKHTQCYQCMSSIKFFFSSSFSDILGPNAFAFIKADVNGNIQVRCIYCIIYTCMANCVCVCRSQPTATLKKNRKKVRVGKLAQFFKYNHPFKLEFLEPAQGMSRRQKNVA